MITTYGEPIPGVLIQLTRPESVGTVYSVTSDSSRYFTVGVEAGSYDGAAFQQSIFSRLVHTSSQFAGYGPIRFDASQETTLRVVFHGRPQRR